MGEVQSALDALAAQDLHGLTDAEVLERTRDLVGWANRVQAELTRTVRHADVTSACEYDGLASMRSLLRGQCHYSAGAAAAVVKAGRALEHLPVLAGAFAEGAVTAAQVGVVADAVTPANVAAAAEQDVDLAVFDEAWAEVAATLPFDRLGAAVNAYRNALDPDGPEPDPTEMRRLSLSTHADGSVSGRFDLDAVGGEKVQAAIEAIVQADRPKGDRRNRAQQQADALVQLCDNQLAKAWLQGPDASLRVVGGSQVLQLPVLRTVKPHVVVTVDIDSLVDPATGHDSAATGFGATISAARARWLACDSTVTRIVLGPDGLPTDVGRTHRVVPPHIRRAVEQRDRHCVFAGCSAPTHWCDVVHHLIHWAFDGDTSLENSALLCERHHTKVHHGFRIVRDDKAPPGQRWQTFRPDGTRIDLTPLLA